MRGSRWTRTVRRSPLWHHSRIAAAMSQWLSESEASKHGSDTMEPEGTMHAKRLEAADAMS
eukprot:10998051-Karenia_brevis.AAC.1